MKLDRKLRRKVDLAVLVSLMNQGSSKRDEQQVFADRKPAETQFVRPSGSRPFSTQYTTPNGQMPEGR